MQLENVESDVVCVLIVPSLNPIWEIGLDGIDFE
jgi:hypothetical protein